MSTDPAQPAPKTKCPICRKPSALEYRPFCSRGCRDRDLINWMDEGYRMPVAPQEDEERED